MNLISRKVLAFLREWYATNDTPPTNKQIAEGAGINSVANVSAALGILRARGHVEYGFRKTMRLVERDEAQAWIATNSNVSTTN